MDSPKISVTVLLVQLLVSCFLITTNATNSRIFREYIGAEGKNVAFSDVPINSQVDFHFILSFAIDYTNSSSPVSTNGDFRVYWDSDNLTPSAVFSIKAQHPNVKVMMSLAGDTVNGKYANFSDFNGIDPDIFVECIGKLLFYLKQNNTVAFTSIAPYDDDSIQRYYLALWKKYGHLIDLVNFQFYAYEKGTTISQFLRYFEIQSSNYEGSKLLVSFGTDANRGLTPENGFFDACAILKKQGKLYGIFIWSADDSKKENFRYEKQSQTLLAS